jgi:hypothetical protein
MAQVEHEGLFTMFKGEPGTRKSTCALSYPGDQYWISTDKKMEALLLPMKRWGISPTSIYYDNYTDWSSPRAKLEQLQVNCRYKTIVVDSITSIGDAMTSQVRKAKGSQGKSIGNISVSGLEEFNAESAAFQEMIALLKDIHGYHKVNVILIAHVLGARKDNDKNKLTHHSRIIVTGAEKISAKIAAYVTEAYHFNVKSAFEVDTGEGTFACFTHHTGNDYARTSLPLPREIEFGNQPLYDKWIAPAILQLKNEAPIQRIGASQSVTPTPPTVTQPTTATSDFKVG